MGKLKEIRFRLAGRIVAYYYNRAFLKAKNEADRRHAVEGCTIYVIDHFIKGKLLSTVNRRQFRLIKHSAQKLHKNSAYWSPQYGIEMLAKTSWYHTADKSGSGGMTEKQIEIRRLAFIRMGLKKARLL